MGIQFPGLHMAREMLLFQLDAAKAHVSKAEDLVERQRAILPSFVGTPMEHDAKNLLIRLEDYLAQKVADLDRLLDLLEREDV